MSKLIPLTRGLHAIVDDDDYDYLIQWKWHIVAGSSGLPYACRRKLLKDGCATNGGMIMMHRLIAEVTSPLLCVDHANRNTLDNRRCNLRKCTKSQNAGNARYPSGSGSKFKGVTLFQETKRWRAQINMNGKKKHIGYFSTQEEAAEAYDRAAIDFWGEFALTNAKLVAAAIREGDK